MPKERHSFRIYSENVNILILPEYLVYPSVIHIRAEIFDNLLDSNRDLIIDCSFLMRIDFTGIKFFEELYKFQKKLGFNLVLSKVSDPNVVKIFKTLDNELLIFDTNEDAVAFLKKLSIK